VIQEPEAASASAEARVIDIWRLGMRVFVTGASGWIAAPLLPELNGRLV
jgi:hypothetical protein